MALETEPYHLRLLSSFFTKLKRSAKLCLNLLGLFQIKFLSYQK